MRMMYEARQYEDNCFVTLTYDDAHLPDDMSLKVRDWQLFAKRVRKRVGRFRFYMCGEYGERTLRPHYHACIFGQAFREDKRLQDSSSGYPLYVSDLLGELWPHGYHLIGDLTFDSAAYVARYVTKKVLGTGEEAQALREKKYRRYDLDTGETWMVRPEFSTMSRGGRGGEGGIGKRHYEKWRDDIYRQDFVPHNGQKFRPPRYFDKLLKEQDPERYDGLVRVRRSAVADSEGNDPARRRDREAVLAAKLKLKERNRP